MRSASWNGRPNRQAVERDATARAAALEAAERAVAALRAGDDQGGGDALAEAIGHLDLITVLPKDVFLDFCETATKYGVHPGAVDDFYAEAVMTGAICWPEDFTWFGDAQTDDAIAEFERRHEWRPMDQ